MHFTSRSRLTRLRALAVLASIPIAGACTYDFAQFEGLSPPADDDAGNGRGGAGGAGGAGKDASADGMAGKGGSSGTGGSGQSGSGGGVATGGSGGATGGSGGATGGSGGAGATTGSGGAGASGGSGIAGSGGSGAVGGSAGKGGAAGSAGSAGSSGTGGKAPDASTDGAGGTGGATGGTGGSTGGSGGTTGGSGGATGGGAGSGGAPIPDASDVKAPPDVAPDNRVVDMVVDTPFDCAAVSGTVYQGHCYFAKSVAVDWNTANTTTCPAPAHLATITSAGEQAVIAALLSTQDRWIGLRRPANSPEAESSFYWVTNETLSYRNWDAYSDADREPNYTGECVRMRFTSMWADAACTDALAVICEHE